MLFCQSHHNGSPPDGPAPPDDAEDDGEALRHSHNTVDDERSDATLDRVVLRKTWLSNAETQRSGQDGPRAGYHNVENQTKVSQTNWKYWDGASHHG